MNDLIDDYDDDDAVHKATGEGSRGGKIIGHTKSGKPIYGAGHAAYAAVESHPHDTHRVMKQHFPDYTEGDHRGAARLHRTIARNSRNRGGASARSHNVAMVAHQDAARGMDYNEKSMRSLNKAPTGEGSRGGHIIGHTKTGKPIYESAHRKYNNLTRTHPKIGKVLKNDWKVGMSMRLKFPDYTAADHEEAATFHQNSNKPNSRFSAGAHTLVAKQMRAYEKQYAKSEASAELLDAMRKSGDFPEISKPTPSLFTDNDANGGPFDDSSDSDLDDFDEDDMNELYDDDDNDDAQKSLRKATGEGSRGGHIIGHTKSGKPIYGAGHASNRQVIKLGNRAVHHSINMQHTAHAHPSYTAQDHRDAADAHDLEAKRSMRAHAYTKANRHAVLRSKHIDLAAEDTHKRASQAVQMATKHLDSANNRMLGFAKDSLNQAKDAMDRGDEVNAHKHALTSIMHSVGRHHDDYQSMRDADESPVSTRQMHPSDTKSEADHAYDLNKAGGEGSHPLSNWKKPMSTSIKSEASAELLDAMRKSGDFPEIDKPTSSLFTDNDANGGPFDDDSNLDDFDEDDLDDAELFDDDDEDETVRKALRKAATGEGSRGGKIIGHTKSGKPIYGTGHAGNRQALAGNTPKHIEQAHPSYSTQDHFDAADVHSELADRARRRADIANSSGYGSTKKVISEQAKEHRHGALKVMHNFLAFERQDKGQKSMTVSKSFNQQELRDQYAHHVKLAIQKAELLARGGPDVMVGHGRAYDMTRKSEAAPDAQIRRTALVTELRGGLDERCARFAKGGSFYQGMAPRLSDNHGTLNKSVVCPSCENPHPAYYTACPACGDGGVLQRSTRDWSSRGRVVGQPEPTGAGLAPMVKSDVYAPRLSLRK